MNLEALGFVAVAAVSSYALTALGRVFAPRIGLLDYPDNRRKSHARPTPLLGGVALYVSFLIAVLYARQSGWAWLDGDPGVRRVVMMLPITGGLFCLVGLWDDKHPMRARTKLLLQIAASIPFVVWGRSLDAVQILGFQFELGAFGAVFTIFWLVACTNIINLVDGLDGLAGTVGLIGCIAAAVLSHMQGVTGVTGLSLIFCGCLLGFLMHNWPPAKIFLGDSGSLLIGFVIGALAIESSLKRATCFTLAVPLVLVSVPAFDTLMAIVRRRLTGRGIAEADRGHIHHCLQDRGLTRKQSLLVISALCFAMAAATIASVYFQNDLVAVGLCALLLVLLVIGRVFGYNETVLFFRYLSTLSLTLADAYGPLRTRMLLARMNRDHATSLDACWDAIAEHVRKMGGEQLEFTCGNELTDEVVMRLGWESDGATPASAEYVASHAFPGSVNRSDSAQNSPQWQFSYSIPGDEGICVHLTASGRSAGGVGSRRIGDLVRIFDAFGRRWLLLNGQTPSINPASASAPLPPLSLPQKSVQIAAPRLLFPTATVGSPIAAREAA